MIIPQTLKERLASRKVIPFVGAGVSMAVCRKDNGMRLFPSWKELLHHAADALDREGRAADANYVRAGLGLDTPDFLNIAEHAKKSLGPSWCPFLKEEFNFERNIVQDASLPLPRTLWRLGSKLIVTTNYDKVLRWSCPNPADCESWNIEHKAELAHFLANQTTEKPTVWHLHGSIEDASRIILTQDGYKLLYSNNAAQPVYAAALQAFRTLLTTHVLLFVGCSFNDEHIGLQLQSISKIFEGCAGSYYALVREDDKARIRSMVLPVEPIVFSEFGQPLIDKLEGLGSCIEPESISIRAEIANPAPATASAMPHYHPANPVFYVPFAQKGDQVIGRDESLSLVRKQLTEGKRTAIGHTASFQGLGGLGKTQLAIEYAYQYRDSYPSGVIWLNADQDIDAQLTELAVTATWIAPESEHKDKLAVARQRLRSYCDCLIIFDNVENQELIRPYLPNPGIESHILVTGRSDQPGFTPISLDPLDPERSFKLLCQESCRKTIDPEEETAAREIVSILGGLPLAIELAGAYLCYRKSFTFKDYLKRLRDDPLKALSGRYLTSFTGHDADIFRTLKINEELFSEEPLLSTILDLLTWSGPAAMGIDLIAHLLDKKVSDLSGALAIGVDLRILQKIPGMDRYALHRLVQEVRRIEFPLPERMEWGEQIAGKLCDWFEALREDFNNLPQYEAEIDHLMSWNHNLEQKLPLFASKFIWLQAYPTYHRGMYHATQQYLIQAMDIFENSSLTDPKLHAHLLDDLGCIYLFLGQDALALPYLQEALSIRTELLGELHHDTATSYDNIGRSYCNQGKYLIAIEYQERALEIRHALFGEHNFYTAMSYNNVGMTYNSLSNYHKALHHIEKSLSISRSLYGEKHPSTATSYDNVGLCYTHLGEYKESLKNAVVAMEIRREVLGERHPDTIASYNNVGNAYDCLGEYHIALKYKEKALEACLEVLGERHPRTATSYDNIGTSFAYLKNYQRALELKKKALEIVRELFGEKDLETAQIYNNLGTLLGDMGSHQQALEYLENSLEIYRDTVGELHSNTATSLNNIAAQYNSMGNYQKAFEFGIKALEIRREVLGERHPDVITGYLNVGRSYLNLRKNGDALRMLRKGVQLAKKELGRNNSIINEFEKGIRDVTAIMARPGFRNPPLKPKRKKR